MNVSKTKVMVTGKEEPLNSGRCPCGVCGKGVNSVLCTECGRWVHQRCSGLQNVAGARNYVCPRIDVSEEPTEVHQWQMTL